MYLIPAGRGRSACGAGGSLRAGGACCQSKGWSVQAAGGAFQAAGGASAHAARPQPPPASTGAVLPGVRHISEPMPCLWWPFTRPCRLAPVLPAVRHQIELLPLLRGCTSAGLAGWQPSPQVSPHMLHGYAGRGCLGSLVQLPGQHCNLMPGTPSMCVLKGGCLASSTLRSQLTDCLPCRLPPGGVPGPKVPRHCAMPAVSWCKAASATSRRVRGSANVLY